MILQILLNDSLLNDDENENITSIMTGRGFINFYIVGIFTIHKQISSTTIVQSIDSEHQVVKVVAEK